MRSFQVFLVAFVVLISAAFVRADGPAATRVGVVNTAKVFNEMKETQDLQAKIKDKTQALADESKKRGDAVEKIRKDRELLNPNTPEFDAKNQEYLRAAIDFRAWGEMQQLEMTREQKTDMARLMNEIMAEVKAMAEENHVDVVLSDQSVDLPKDLEPVTVDQLRQALNTRNVLFANSAVDLTARVTAALDANYAKNGPTTNP